MGQQFKMTEIDEYKQWRNYLKLDSGHKPSSDDLLAPIGLRIIRFVTRTLQLKNTLVIVCHSSSYLQTSTFEYRWRSLANEITKQRQPKDNAPPLCRVVNRLQPTSA